MSVTDAVMMMGKKQPAILVQTSEARISYNRPKGGDPVQFCDSVHHKPFRSLQKSVRAVEKASIFLRLPDLLMRVPYDCHWKEFLVKVVNLYQEAIFVILGPVNTNFVKIIG
ncbi:MAG: hypothetical protein AB2660_18535 [Candidatus Thiodiazotropha sp.]